jgi:hypothetical protein
MYQIEDLEMGRLAWISRWTQNVISCIFISRELFSSVVRTFGRRVLKMLNIKLEKGNMSKKVWVAPRS